MIRPYAKTSMPLLIPQQEQTHRDIVRFSSRLAQIHHLRMAEIYEVAQSRQRWAVRLLSSPKVGPPTVRIRLGLLALSLPREATLPPAKQHAPWRTASLENRRCPVSEERLG